MTMTRFALRQRGLTITELMVSVAISIVVLSALVYVYVGSRGAYRTNEAVARVQETGRFALEWIARDIRSAGYFGCASRATSIEIYTRSGAGAIPFGAGIWGYEDGAGFSTTATPRTNPTSIPHVRGDVLVLSFMDDSANIRVVEQDAQNANIKVAPTTPFQKDDDLLATDCQRAALFNATNISGGNCNVGGGPFGCTTIVHAATGNNPHRIPSFGRDGRAIVARLARVGYFIGTNRGGRPSLYRFETSGQAVPVPAQEVVENVEDIDFLYGVDTNSDGAVDAYADAAAVTAANQWDRVLSVRVSLVAVSSEAAATPRQQEIYLRDTSGDTVVDSQSPRMAGTADQRRLRQTFTSTVALRNRLS